FQEQTQQNKHYSLDMVELLLRNLANEKSTGTTISNIHQLAHVLMEEPKHSTLMSLQKTLREFSKDASKQQILIPLKIHNRWELLIANTVSNTITYVGSGNERVVTLINKLSTLF